MPIIGIKGEYLSLLAPRSTRPIRVDLCSFAAYFSGQSGSLSIKQIAPITFIFARHDVVSAPLGPTARSAATLWPEGCHHDDDVASPRMSDHRCRHRQRQPDRLLPKPAPACRAKGPWSLVCPALPTHRSPGTIQQVAVICAVLRAQTQTRNFISRPKPIPGD